MITEVDLPLTSIHGVLHRRPSLLRSTVVFLLVEAEAIGVEEEAVDEIATSTSLVKILLFWVFMFLGCSPRIKL